jgi:hypothetical protein
VVGAVLAVQATNSPEVSLDESSSEAVDQPAIGFACVAGTVVCEEVKDILLETDYEEVLRTWTRSSLIDYFVGRHGRSLTFVTEVVDAVRFDWGDGSTYIGDFESDGASASAGACVSGEPICDAARYVLVKSGQGKNFTRENFIEVWMSTYGASREQVEAIVSAIGFTDWKKGRPTLTEFVKAVMSAPDFNWEREPFITYLMNSYNESRANVITAIDADGYDWVGTAAARRTAYLELVARNGIESIPRSRTKLINFLVEFVSATQAEAVKAVDSLGVDWNLQARKVLLNLSSQILEQTGISRNWFIYNLVEGDLFNESEAVKAVDALGLDYYEQAVRATISILSINRCDAQGVIGSEWVYDQLLSRGFEQDEADFGIDSQIGYDDNGWWWIIDPQCVVPYG